MVLFRTTNLISCFRILTTYTWAATYAVGSHWQVNDRHSLCHVTISNNAGLNSPQSKFDFEYVLNYQNKSLGQRFNYQSILLPWLKFNSLGARSSICLPTTMMATWVHSTYTVEPRGHQNQERSIRCYGKPPKEGPSVRLSVTPFIVSESTLLEYLPG